MNNIVIMNRNNNDKNESPFKHFVIGELWPCVKSIVISVEEANNFINDAKESPSGRSYYPTNFCDFTFPCVNPTCTCGLIELYDEVSKTIHERKTKTRGKKYVKAKQANYTTTDVCLS